MPDINAISFSKMHGTGNDFVVIDNREMVLSLEEAVDLAPKICNRKFGVGADGILLLEQSDNPELDYTMVYRNADGSNAGMCGNGARCLALYASKLGLGNSFTFNVHDRQYHAKVKDNNHILVDFSISTTIHRISDVAEQTIYRLHTGTEHVVIRVSSSYLQQDKTLRNKGATLRDHRRFSPKGTNVNFFYDWGDTSIQLKTYERGVEDLTLACGTGAIASALTWHHIQESTETENCYKVHTEGGLLNVEFLFKPKDFTYSRIKLIGPAEIVFNGEYYV